MMTAISGEWGVGKTKLLAQKVEQAARAGHYVVTNFSHAFTNLDCSSSTPEDFLDRLGQIVEFKMAGGEPSDIFLGFRYTTVSIFIDEGTLYFSPEMQDRMRKRNEVTYDRLQSLIAQVRKFDIRIFYTVQNFARIGKDFRRLTDEWIYVRWAIRWHKFVPVLHPTKPTIRLEMRNRFPLVFMEWHEIDPENPILNYSMVRDEDGIRRLSEKSTLKKRRWRWASGKNYLFKMYNSFQPMGIGGKLQNVDFMFLKDESAYVVPDFGKEDIPNVKKLLRFIGKKLRIRSMSSIKLNDEVLPTKVFFEGIQFFFDDDSSKVHKLPQEEIRFSRDSLHRSIWEGFSRKKIVTADDVIRRAVRETQKRREPLKEGSLGAFAKIEASSEVVGE